MWLREGRISDAVRASINELRGAANVFAAARTLLKTPAKVWTENALVQCRYVRLMIDENHAERLR